MKLIVTIRYSFFMKIFFIKMNKVGIAMLYSCPRIYTIFPILQIAYRVLQIPSYKSIFSNQILVAFAERCGITEYAGILNCHPEDQL